MGFSVQIVHTNTKSIANEATYDAPVVVAIPSTNLELAVRSAKLMSRRAGTDGLILILEDVERSGFIATCNTAFKMSSGGYFVYAAQDAFAGRLWLKIAVHQIEKHRKNMLAFNDGKWHGLLASFGMVKREWAQANYKGELFCPLYHSHFGDAELTVIAKQQDSLCFSPRSVLLEVDWEKDDRKVNRDDKNMFRRRAASGFDGKLKATGNVSLL
ncbi:hypothetical protein [Hydrogenophaga sp. ZJX-1]|uniref:hypothetical protein n=1 Tax=Hydrogenophaga sp. ZJX-1 TaxID=3404778 RepID=UPI003B289CDA